MIVERIDYSSDEDYQQAQMEEVDAKLDGLLHEPEVVPCHRCGVQMYEKSRDPNKNFCDACEENYEKNILNNWKNTKKKWEKDGAFQGESNEGKKFRYLKKRAIEIFNTKMQTELGFSYGSSEEKLVLGRGNTSATFMFIGEVPSREDNEERKAFVGKSGVVLDMLLESSGIKTNMPEEYDDYYITNLIKLKPNKISQLTPEDADRCFKYLKDEISLIRPEYIICLGDYVIRTLFKYYGVSDSPSPIDKIHGQLFEGFSKQVNKDGTYDKVKLVAMYSPHRGLYHKKERKVMLDDMNILSGDYLYESIVTENKNNFDDGPF